MATSAPKDAAPGVAAAAPAANGCCCGGCDHCCGAAKPETWGMAANENRKCRDVLCCALFAVFWAGMIAVGIVAFQFGQWQRLLYGTDYQGNTCGVGGLTASTFITYPRTNEDFLANSAKASPLDYTFYGICVPSCPLALDVVCNYNSAAAPLNQTQRRACWASTAAGCAGVNDGSCWITPMTTSSVLFHCVPNYNVSTQVSTACIFPASVTNAADTRCVVAQVSTSGTTQQPAQPNLLFDQLNTAGAVWGRWFGDLARCWWVILVCGVGVAVVASFVWVQLLKYFTACMVWTTIWLVVLTVAALTGFFYYKAGLVVISVTPSLADQIAAISGVNVNTTIAGAVTTAQGLVPASWNTVSSSSSQAYSYVAYVSTGVLIVLLCIIASLISSISTAIQVIKIGCRALQAMPELLIMPLANIAALSLFLVWWVFVAASLESAGIITTTNLGGEVTAALATLPALPSSNSSLGFNLNTTFSSVATMPVIEYLEIYHVVRSPLAAPAATLLASRRAILCASLTRSPLPPFSPRQFGLLWTASFIQGIGSMTIAGSVCAWYFSQLPKELEGVEEFEKLRFPRQRCVACRSLCRTVRYYCGCVAFGSLLIAVIQMIRLAFLYLQRQMAAAGKSNTLIKFLFCVVQCCLKVLQSIIEAVTTNAYIFVALKGQSFCSSGAMVFKLIVSHGAIFAAVNVLGTIIVFLGQIVIAVAAACVAYIILENSPQFQPTGATPLTASWLPVLVVLLFGYVTASCFMSVFDLSIDSVLVCYCTDVDENVSRHGGDIKFKTSLHMSANVVDSKKADESRKSDATAASAAKASGGAAIAPQAAAEAAGAEVTVVEATKGASASV